MVDTTTFSTTALSFDGVVQRVHFDRTEFKVVHKRIYATLHEESTTADILFSKIDQSVYCDIDKPAIYPVPNKFGLHGWTTFALKEVTIELVADALFTAYQPVLKTKP